MRNLQPYYVSPRVQWYLVLAGGVSAMVAWAFTTTLRLGESAWSALVAFLIGVLLTYLQYRVTEVVAGRRLR